MEERNAYRADVNEIQKYLPHRSPFLLIDRVLEIHPQGSLENYHPEDKVGTKVIALKNVSFNEPFMQGHFPEFAIMPGVLIVEAMAQTAAMTLYPQARNDLERFKETFQVMLVGVNAARFRKPVVPGDALRIESVVEKTRGSLWFFKATAMVDGAKVAEAELMANFSVADRNETNENSRGK